MVDNIKIDKKSFPVVPLRDTVVFPEFVVPLFVGRPKSINAIEKAFESSKMALFVTQKDPIIDSISMNEIYNVGTIGMIDHIIKLADGTVKILVTGVYRAIIDEIVVDNDIMLATIRTETEIVEDENAIAGLMMAALSDFEIFAKQSKKISIDVVAFVSSIENPSKLTDAIASYLPLKISEKQSILENFSVNKRLEKIIFLMEEKIELSQVEKKIKARVKKQVEKNQKEYYLNEQLKAIYKELGDQEDFNHEIKLFEKKIKKSQMAKEAQEKAMLELKKLRNIAPLSQESGIIRTYLDWLINLPWVSTKSQVDMKYSEETLDSSHYGLEKVKERIMEYLAVQKRVTKMKAQIMCFVGAPGVGKTSLGQAIAKATQKEFVRISLGGISDEAEIRGHRRTYIGAMPGKIIQAMKKAKTLNPVIMLDEIDKIGADWKGDPASALLEVLDPEQNNAFTDNYIEVPYDLSEVMFITTANSLDIPRALLDRMEVIHISGYTEEEKINIARKYILPKQIAQNGLQETELDIADDAIRSIVQGYTMESGVRGLERQLAKIARKTVRKIVSNPEIEKISIIDRNLKVFLGTVKYEYLTAAKEPQTGVVTGLAWTENGGDVLQIESLMLAGSGNIICTGRLGEVMQESIKAAYSFVKSQMKKLKLKEDNFSKNDIHIHVPEGNVPKDGPSAGITICTAIVSAFTNKKVKSDVAMTGEITLVGKVLGIGGLKEKLLAAKRTGIKTVFIPQENEKDLEELPKSLLDDLSIICVNHVEQVLAEVFA